MGARWPAPRATHALPLQAGSASPVSLPPAPQIQRAPPSPGAEGRSQSQGGSVAWTETVLVLETASSLRSPWTREGRAGREAGLIRSWRGAVAAQEVWRVCGLPPRRPPAPGSPGLLGDGVTRGPKPEAEAAGAGVEGPRSRAPHSSASLPLAGAQSGLARFTFTGDSTRSRGHADASGRHGAFVTGPLLTPQPLAWPRENAWGWGFRRFLFSDRLCALGRF